MKRESDVRYVLLFAISLTGAFGDVWLYRGARNSSVSAIALGLASWLVSLALFVACVRDGDRGLGVNFAVVAALHVVFVLGYDWFAFRPEYTWREQLGMALALLGVLLIEWKE